MTGHDPAATIREALENTIRTVPGYTGPDVWWKAQVEDALAALAELEQQLADLADALAAAGLPAEAGSKGLIRHHRANASLAVGFDAMAAEAALAEANRRNSQHERILFLAEHLFQMVPQSAWRDSGGDDWQGHYEGDYHAEQVREELVIARAALDRHTQERA